MGHLGNGNAKHQEDCSKKQCSCGGHNASNPKKNKRHHATKKRLEYREGRKKKSSG